jgi:hypothetical protein
MVVSQESSIISTKDRESPKNEEKEEDLRIVGQRTEERKRKVRGIHGLLFIFEGEKEP